MPFLNINTQKTLFLILLNPRKLNLLSDVGPEHKAPPPVATQLVVPSELSDAPVTLTCYNCQEHITTTTKTGPSTLSWAACLCMCLCL